MGGGWFGKPSGPFNVDFRSRYGDGTTITQSGLVRLDAEDRLGDRAGKAAGVSSLTVRHSLHAARQRGASSTTPRSRGPHRMASLDVSDTSLVRA